MVNTSIITVTKIPIGLKHGHFSPVDETIDVFPQVKKVAIGLKQSDTANSVSKLPIGLKTEHANTKIKLFAKKPEFAKMQGKIKIVAKLTGELRKMQFTGQLFEFQEIVMNWSRDITRGILGLDMGLGKTIVTIDIICDRNYSKTVIVLPLTLLDQWHNAFLTFTDIHPEEIILYQGDKRESQNFQKARVILTTYDVVRKDMENPQSALFRYHTQLDCVVLDEAHKIRNRDTKTYETCYSLGLNCKSKWLLTGTTIHNKFDDFMTLAQFLNLPDFSSDIFTDQDLIQNWKKKYYYRLTKADCKLQLPEKSLHEHYLDFDEDHWESYIEILTEVKQIYTDYLSNPTQLNFTSLLAKILRLRQCCNHPNAMLSADYYSLEKNLYKNPHSAKFKKIVEIVNATPSDDKILIFSQWEHSLSLLGKYLDENNITHLEYNGQIGIDDKNRVLKKFKDTSAKVLLVTLTSGGVGLNLNFANHVIIMDSWWNPALEEQAIDRVYRIGQKKKVDVHRLYMKETIEEWLIEMKKEKQLVDSKFHNDNIPYVANKSLLKDLLHMHI